MAMLTVIGIFVVLIPFLITTYRPANGGALMGPIKNSDPAYSAST